MTELELLTERWYLIQEARLKELQKLTEKTPRNAQMALIEQMNGDPFWEHIFDLLEKAIFEIDPQHPFLSVNQIPI